MARIGQNPLRQSPAQNKINDIVLLVVTHLPDDSEYHAERFEIVKACLHSMRTNAGRKHTFYVWDNGSSEMFREWVYNEFKPDILALSPNIGKTAARTSAITSLPLTSLVCYSDDDILYYKNWLQPQIDIMNFFPNVSVVSGYPVRTMFRWGYKNTLNWARKEAVVEMGKFIPDEYEKDFCESIGRSYEEHLQKTEKDLDILITYENRKVYGTAHHCQFIAYAGRILPALQYDGMSMGPEISFDNALDSLGLRLCTTERICRHMGNHIDDKLKKEIDELYMVKA